MHIFELLLGLLAFCLVLAFVAERLRVPVAVPLVLGGIVVAFVPWLPDLELDPGLALALFLPPLLQLSAYRTDWPAFRTSLSPILLLATGAVLFSAAVIAFVAKWMIPTLPWGAAVALGAIVAPPDAVAAASVLRRLGPPKHLVTVLEGESLLNDAASLVLYRFAVAATIAGSFSVREGAVAFLLTAVGGAAIGYAVGRIAVLVFALLRETAHDIMFSVLLGFGAYHAAEAAHASGVLSVVFCGLVLGRRQHHAFTARTRLEAAAVWSFLEFALASIIFMLIGMQLRGIVSRLGDYDPSRLAMLALAISGALILSRFAWVVPMAWAPRLFARAENRPDPPPASHLFVLGWAGMRGVVSLAAALALPLGFPGRDIIVFLAFSAIFATLVLQGTTLGPLMRALGMSGPDRAGEHVAQLAARRRASEAALNTVAGRLDDPERHEAASALVDEYRDRAEQVARLEREEELDADGGERELALRLEAIEASRAELTGGDDVEDDAAARAVVEELDLEEEQIRREIGEER